MQNSEASQPASGRMRLEQWAIERLIPSARNARTHSEGQISEIAGSICAFGFTNPILVGDGGDVIAGHGRLAAARKLGLSEVPVVVLHGLTELERRQLMLADNRIALNAGWDLEMLALELTDLRAWVLIWRRWASPPRSWQKRSTPCRLAVRVPEHVAMAIDMETTAAPNAKNP